MSTYDKDNGFYENLGAVAPDILGGVDEIVSGNNRLSYNDVTSVDQVVNQTKQRNSKIGGAIGGALALTGMGALMQPLGKLIGGMFGARKARERGEMIVNNKRSKKMSTASLYQDLAKDTDERMQRDSAFFS